MREPYLDRIARQKREAREWYDENVLKRTETERRIANMRDQLESKEVAASQA